MKNLIMLVSLGLIFIVGCSQQLPKQQDTSHFRNLTKQEEWVIVHKGTEAPFSGKYNDFDEQGTYVCKRCGVPLFTSDEKFHSGTGWPSFDDAIPETVKRIPDADGQRTEIVCNYCGAHLGHVFEGEGFTPKNTRYCVNSISLDFIPAKAPEDPSADTAIFAGGCFWGVEYYMQQTKGVISTDVGYIGGHTANPTYKAVSSHTTGYAEAVRVIYDPQQTTYEELAKLFFNIHDPTQVNRQGPDVGDQYRSEIFYLSMQQKQIAEKLIAQLKDKGYKVATKVAPAGKFYEAEKYHQDYYKKNNGIPYCHFFTKRL